MTRAVSARARLLSAGGSQALSSATNLISGVLVLRFGGGLDGFSDFALASTVYLVILSLYRSLVAEPLLALPTDSPNTPDAWRATYVVAGIGLVAVVCLTIPPQDLLIGDAVWLALALSLPGLLVQDHLRQLSFRVGDLIAGAVDAVWLAALLFLWFVVAAFEVDAGSWLGIALWGGAGSFSALVFLSGRRPSSGSVRAWLSGPGNRGPRFAAEFLIERSGFQVSSVAFAAIAGVATFGQWRVAQLLVGPLTVIHATAFSVLVPVFARLSSDRHAFERVLIYSFFGLVLTDALVVAALAFAPSSWLSLLVGDESVPARTLILLVGGYTTLWGVSAVGRAAHRADRRLVGSFLIRVLTGLLSLAALLPVLLWPTSVTFAGAILVGAAVTSTLWVASCLRTSP